MASCFQQIFDALPTKRADAISHFGLRALFPQMDKANFSNAISMLKKNSVIQYERQRFYFRLPNAVRPNSNEREQLMPIQIAIANLIATSPLVRVGK